MAIGSRDEQLDVLESRLASILGQLDITLSAVRDELSGGKDLAAVEAAIKGLQTAAETLQDVINAVIGLKGASSKDFTTLEEDIEAVHAAVKGQRTAGVSGQVSVGTSGTQLPSHAVAPGCEVAVWADPNNTDKVAVNIGAAADPVSHALLAPGQGVSFKVSNTDLIYLKAASGTQTIYWAVEV